MTNNMRDFVPEECGAMNDASAIVFPLLFATSMFVFVEPAPFDLIALGLCAAVLVNSRVRIVYLPALIGFCFVFFMVRAITLLFPEQLGSSLRFFGITTYLSVAAVFLAGFIAVRGPKCVTLIITGLYIGTVVTFIAYVCVKVGIEVGSDITMAYERSRFRGFFKDPNVLGPALVPVFICALGGLLTSAKTARAVHGAMLLMSGVMIIASLSRGAWLSLTVALAVFALVATTVLNLRYLTSLVVAVALAAAATVAIVSYSGVLPELGESVLERIEEKRYDQDRFMVQGHLLELSWQRLWGYGPGEANRFAERLNAEESNAAHNTYIRLLFENGVLGLAAFVALLAATCLVAVQTLRGSNEATIYAACGVAVVLSVAANAFFVDTLHWRHFWIFLAIVWGLWAWERRRAFCALSTSTGSTALAQPMTGAVS